MNIWMRQLSATGTQATSQITEIARMRVKQAQLPASVQTAPNE